MTLPDTLRMLRHWRINPPVHELLALLARVFTTWRPDGETAVEDTPVPISELPEFEA